MTVRELIEKLRLPPQDKEVVVLTPEYWDGYIEAREPFDDSHVGEYGGKVVL